MICIDFGIENCLKSFIVVKSYDSIQIQVNGITGQINFDQDGLRNTFFIDVLELKRNRNDDYPYEKIGKYQCPSKDNIQCNPIESNDDENDKKDDIEYSRNYTSGEEASTDMQSREFTVYMRLGEPYLRIK